MTDHDLAADVLGAMYHEMPDEWISLRTGDFTTDTMAHAIIADVLALARDEDMGISAAVRNSPSCPTCDANHAARVAKWQASNAASAAS